eukprot:c7132_g1_i1.p1 GENE.c7132_g1_i1~~c7132_g1_i1.p1  ORF type:complete len:205 (-),score=96.22 c7132_g1_i1:66-680(-)
MGNICFGDCEERGGRGKVEPEEDFAIVDESNERSKKKYGSNNTTETKKPETKTITTKKQEVVQEALFFPQDGSIEKILSWLSSAQVTLDIAVFTLTHKKIRDEILNAHRRGVKVRIITDDEKVSEKGSEIKTFQNAGISVRTDHSSSHMHHKYCIIDGKILLNGSLNWTAAGATENNENVMITNQSAFVSSFQKNFEKMWIEFA